MRVRLIEDHRDVWPVRVLCEALGVSRSGFEAWRSRPESPRQIAHRELLNDIRRFMPSTGAAMGHRASPPNCVPGARVSAATGSSR